MEHKPGEGAKQPYIFSHERAGVLDESLAVPSGSRVLDFGTGTGRYGVALAQTRPDLRVVAYDVQPEMLDIVRRRTADLRLENFSAATWEDTQTMVT